jgi:hypothetical protein
MNKQLLKKLESTVRKRWELNSKVRQLDHEINKILFQLGIEDTNKLRGLESYSEALTMIEYNEGSLDECVEDLMDAIRDLKGER